METTSTKSNEDEMVIKIQTFENITPISVKRNSSVQDLKDKILENFSVPVLKQRLIFQGKLLQNSEKLRAYKISDESVIHLVAKSMEDNGSQNVQSNQTNPQNTQNNQNYSSDNSEGRINIEDIFPSLIELPILRSNRRQRRRRMPHFDISECFESMHQNLTTVQNLVNCKAKFDESIVGQTRTITAFDLTKSKYEVGQWVDVKDTIDQWLEAQVIAVRGNQAYVHYNGWGTRWDEWIDFSSPRIAPFKTYTMQGPTSVFLSPYPHVACDANVESQPRSIDTFFYMEKAFACINEVNKMADYMARLRKKNTSQGRVVRRDDFEIDSREAREKESQARNSTNTIMLNTMDYELLFHTTQIIPMMDRCGRLLSDVSLQLSHLVLNPSLYPQLLLGHNNMEVSDTMSCTSGYSMYTNEGSTISGFNQMTHNFLNDQSGSVVNNLQNRSGIINSNQMVSNYSNANPNLTSNVNLNTQGVITSNNQNTNENRTGTSSSGFNIDSFPKINLQIPAMLSPGEVAMYNGYNSLLEPNIDIYVHTLVSGGSSTNTNNTTTTNNITNIPNNNSLINSNPLTNSQGTLTSNSNPYIPTSLLLSQVNVSQNQTNSLNTISNLNPNNIITNPNSILNNNQNVGSSSTNNNLLNNNLNTQIFSENDLVENRREPTSTANSVTNANTSHHDNPQGLNNLLENLMTMIGQRRRGSVTSDTSNNSTTRLGNNNVTSLLNSNTTTLRNRIQTQRHSSPINHVTSLNSLYRETGTQTDMTLNLLLNKENNFTDNMMDVISNKSNRSVTGMSLKNRGAFSYKSVSEISEFEEIDQEEPTEFAMRDNKKESVNESMHSVNSHVSKDIFEDKDEELNTFKNLNNLKNLNALNNLNNLSNLKDNPSDKEEINDESKDQSKDESSSSKDNKEK